MSGLAVNVNKVTTGCAPVEFAVVGMLENNVYFVEDGEGGVIVCDPSDQVDDLLAVIGDRKVSAIFVTHRHFDHVGALAALKEATGAPVYCGAIDVEGIEGPKAGSHGVVVDPCKVDYPVDDDQMIVIGKTAWQVLHTPGHTKGGVCYYLDPENCSIECEGPRFPLLLSGDTLFHQSTGRTDFEGGSEKDMLYSMRRLGLLSDDTLVLPGHSSLSTIGRNRFWVIEAYARFIGLEE